MRPLALAAVLIGCLAVSAHAQKAAPKSANLLTWETVAADKAAKMTTRRASVPGGWLVLVQIDEEISLTFFPDAGRRWDDGSPSDAKPPQAGPPKAGSRKAADNHEFDDIRAATDKLRRALEESRARALDERDKAEAAAKRAEEERKRRLDELEKARKDKRPKKGDKGDQAIDAGKETLERKRIDEALGLAAREQAQQALERAGVMEAAARRQAQDLQARTEAVAQQLQKQLSEATKALEDARVQAEKATAEARRLQAELDQAKKDIERLKALPRSKKKK